MLKFQKDSVVALSWEGHCMDVTCLNWPKVHSKTHSKSCFGYLSELARLCRFLALSIMFLTSQLFQKKVWIPIQLHASKGIVVVCWSISSLCQQGSKLFAPAWEWYSYPVFSLVTRVSFQRHVLHDRIPALKLFFFRRPLPFGGSPLEAYPWTSGESNHHRQSVRVAKNDALPTEPRGHLIPALKLTVWRCYCLYTKGVVSLLQEQIQCMVWWRFHHMQRSPYCAAHSHELKETTFWLRLLANTMLVLSMWTEHEAERLLDVFALLSAFENVSKTHVWSPPAFMNTNMNTNITNLLQVSN